MNFMTASIEITVDDKPVKVKLEDVRKAFGKTVNESDNLVKKFGDTVKRLAIAAAGIYAVKKAFDVLRGVVRMSIREALAQEDATFGVAAAMKAMGDYSDTTMMRLRDFANTMQELTTNTDDQVLSMMMMMRTLGVQSNQLRLAAQMAIGMGDALGMNSQATARYIALAMQGEFTILRRYIPALRTAKDDMESLAIVTEFASKAFEISVARTQTASGAIKQMKNAVGEASEAIGFALLPSLKETAVAIRDWALTHKDMLGSWARTAVTYVMYVKDVFVELVVYLRNDWSQASSLAFQTVLELAKGFVKALLVILREGARQAAIVFVDTMEAIIDKGLARIARKVASLTPAGLIGKAAKGLFGGPTTPTGTTETEAGVGKELEQIMQNTFTNIKTLTNQHNLDLSDAASKRNDRLLELERVLRDETVVMETDLNRQVIDLAEESANLRASLAKRAAEDIKKTTLKSMDDQIRALQMVNSGQARTAQSAQELLAIQERLGEGTAATAQMWDLYREKERKILSLERWREFASGVNSTLGSAFDRLIFEGQKFGDFMNSLLREVMQQLIRIQFIQPFTQWLSAGITMGTSAVMAPVAHSGLTVGQHSSNKRTVPSYIFNNARRFHGLKQGEQAIIAEKGEVISRGDTQGGVTNINIHAIDTQSGLSFLMKHSRDIANMNRMTSKQNHPNRRGG